MLKTKEEKKGLIYYLLLIVFSLFIGYISLGKGFDFDTYPGLDGDGLLGMASIKSIDENGLMGSLFNSRIGAPETASLIDFPAFGTTAVIIIWILSLLTDSIPQIMYMYLILSFCIDSVSMSLLMRKLKFNRETSFVISSLFAFAPYHFYRYISHSSLIDYSTIPAAIYLSLCILGIIKEEKTWKMAAAAVFLGIGYGYYYAFGLIMMAVAYCIKFIILDNKKQIIDRLWIIAVTLATVFLTLLPKIIYSLTNGANEVVGKRYFAEQEYYGLKIINLLLPVSYSRIPIFRTIYNIYATSGAPLINENRFASLGAIGAVGFVILCAALIISLVAKNKCDNDEWKLIDFLSLETLVFVLIGSIGGFGEIFNALVTAQIRCYNRASIVITALSLLMIAVLLNKIELKKKTLSCVVCAGVLAAGCYDQVNIQNTQWQEGIRPVQNMYESYFSVVEDSLEPGAMVYQLPYMDFPEVPPLYKINDYKHFIGYVFTDELRWSYGGVKGREEAAKNLNIDEGKSINFLNGIKNAGFKAVYIDTDGYADGGIQILSFYNSLGIKPIVSSDGKLYVYDISKLDLPTEPMSHVYNVIYMLYAQYGEEMISAEELSNIENRIVQNDTAVYAEISDMISAKAPEDSEFIHVLFSSILLRDEAETENIDWVNHLKNGVPRQEVVRILFNCDEFKNNANAQN